MLHNVAFESIFKGMGWGGNKLWNQFRKLFGVPVFRVCTLFCNVLREDDLTFLFCYFHNNSQLVTWITPPLQEINAVFPSVKMAEESHWVYAPHWGYSAFFSIRCQLFWAAKYIDTVQILTFQVAKILLCIIQCKYVLSLYFLDAMQWNGLTKNWFIWIILVWNANLSMPEVILLSMPLSSSSHDNIISA